MRHRIRCHPFSLALIFGLAASAHAATLQVGPSRTYTTINAAVAAAHSGDEIDVDPGTYTGNAVVTVINTANLTIKGVGGRPKLDAFGVDAGGKGIFDQESGGTNLTVDNIEFANAVCSSQNGAGIRGLGSGLTVRNCVFHDCQDGILNGIGTVLIEHCEFFNNGYGDVGYTHNLYINSTCTDFTFQYNYTHNCHVGHDLKSRATLNKILYNRITDEDGAASYNIDLPQGGTAYIIGNLIQKGPHAQNEKMIAYKEEGATNPDTHLYVINNTLVNDLGWGIFVWNQSSTTAQITNNIFFGAGTTVSGPATTATNLVTSDSSIFVDRSGYNYHLMPTAASAINAGTAQGAGLVATLEYVHPLSFTARPSAGVIDIGAYEFSPNAITGTVSGSAPGATLTLSGAATGSTLSGTNGAYSLDGLANGVYTVTPTQPGYVFTPSSAPVTLSGGSVTKNFAATGYSVTLAAGANGTIDLPGVQSAAIAATITAHATPNGTFHFVNWTDNSTPSRIVGTSPTLSASSAQAGKTITANFAANGSYAVNLVAGVNGAISLSGVQSAASGATISVTATPNPSFQFLNWTDNAVPPQVISSSATLVVDSSLEGRTLTANFGQALTGFTVSIVAGAHGSVFGITPQIVGHNGDCMPVTANPDPGYHFVNWTGTNNFVTSAINPIDAPTITGDEVDKTITANFAPDVFNLTGSVTGAPNATLVTITLKLPDNSTLTTHPAANGAYSFSGLPSASYTLTPSLAGYSFSPAGAVVAINAADAAAPLFTASVSLPPTITSVVATPNAANTGDTVTFTAGATDNNGGTLTYLWDFGDGTTSTLAAPQHAFTTSGAKAVTLTVTSSNHLTASGTVSVQVTDAGGSGGSGGGGSGGSGSGGAGGGGTSNPQPMTVSLLIGSVHFSANHANSDVAKISGTLMNVPSPFAPAGQTLSLNLSGAQLNFTLTSKGKGTAPNGTIALKLKLIKATKSKVKSAPSYAGGNIPFTASFKKGAYASQWGMTATTPASSMPLTVTITLNGTVYSSGAVNVNYKPGKGSGTFEK